MKISSAIVFEKKEGISDQYVELYLNDEVHRVVFADFRSNLSEESRQDPPTSLEEIGATAVGQNTPHPAPTEPPLKGALDFLLKDVLPDGGNITSDDELIIESDSHLLLRLPWETRVDPKKTVVLRQIAGGSSSDRKEIAAKNRARFLIIKSYAYQLGNTKLNELSDNMKEEVRDIVGELIENAQSGFRVGDVHIIKHGTKEELSRLDFGSVHYVHMVMHGRANGELCLETNASPDQIDLLTRDEFLSLLERAGVNGVLLFFLSFCHSGGGNIPETNLSFELINRGIAEYALSYDGGVGDGSAKDFARLFYVYIAAGKSIRDSFITAYRNRTKMTYTPLLYGRFLEKGTT